MLNTRIRIGVVGFISLWLVSAGIAPPAQAASPLPRDVDAPPYETERLGDGLYAFRWGVYRNILLVTDEGVIVTDPMGDELAKVLRDEISKLTDKPVKYVVHSQSHWDHASGGRLFKKEGAQIIAHEKCAANMKERPHPEVVPPDITFSDFYSVKLGGKSLDLYYFGPSDDDCGIVIVPSTAPLLYITDTANPGPSGMTIPWNPMLPDLHPHNIIQFYKSLEALGQERGLTHFVGGHTSLTRNAEGKRVIFPTVGPFSYLSEKRELWERIFAAVKVEFDKGTPADQIPDLIDQKQFSFVRNYNKENMWVTVRRIAEYFDGGRYPGQPAMSAETPEVHIEPVADGLYAFRSGDVRSFFMIGDEGVLVVDPVSTPVAKALRRKISDLTDKPVTHVVYSHSLNARAAGGKLYHDEGAKFIAHDTCDANFREAPLNDVVLPEETFASIHTVSLGSKSLDLYYLGLHYDCSIVMITRPDNLMFVVGTVNPPNAMVPTNPSMSNVFVYNLVPFLMALDALAKQENVQSLIASKASMIDAKSGNGRVSAPTGPVAIIAEQQQFWERLFADVDTAHLRGIPGSWIGGSIDHTPYEALPGYDKRNLGWIARRIQTALVTGK